MKIRWTLIAVFSAIALAATAVIFSSAKKTSRIWFSSAQTEKGDSLKKLFRQWVKLQPTEKAWLISDKPLYGPGETIWFSVFLSPANPEIRNLSEIVYVELLNPKGSVEKKFSLIARNGKANGDYTLSTDATGGLYKLKAYTRWMEAQNRSMTKEIQVQEFILPVFRLSMDLDKKSYKAGNQLSAEIQADAADNKPLDAAKLEFSILAGDQVLLSQAAFTDASGHFKLDCVVPQVPAGKKAVLVCTVSKDGESESVSQTIPMVEGEPFARLFPEGGDYVSGRLSRIAFRVFKPDSTAADASGWLVDQTGTKLIAIKTLHDGLGSFLFRAQAGKQYSIAWESPAKFVTSLPEPLERGYSLSVRAQNGEAAVSVFGIGKEKLQLMVRMRDRIVWSSKINSDETISKLKTQTTTWGPGLAIFSLFDSRGLLRCERMAFVNPDKRLKIKIKTDKERYSIREKVNVSVSVSDPAGIPVPAKLALGVSNDGLLRYADDKQGNLLSGLLLEQELETKVNDPGFYFSGKANSIEALDLLTLTYGWRGISWSKMLSEAPEASSISPEKAVIAGTVMNEMTNQPLRGAKLEIGKIKIMSDSSGNFRFPFIDLSKPVQVKISYKKQAVMERTISVYSDQTILYYNPYPVMYDKMVPMMAQEGVALPGIPGMAQGNVRRNNFDADKMAKPEQRRAKARGEQKAKAAEKIARLPFPGFLPQEGENQESPYYLSRKYPELPAGTGEKRCDFRTTLYWSGIVDLDNNGRGNFSFRTADDLATWRISAQALGPEGLPGYQDGFFSTVLPYSVSAKLPFELTSGDESVIPVAVRNQSNKKQEFVLSLQLKKGLSTSEVFPKNLVLEAGQTKEIPIRVLAGERADSSLVHIELKTSQDSDVWEKTIRIVPRGYPVSVALSGREMEKAFLTEINAPVQGSIRVHATAFPDVTSDLLTGVESILAEPYGCFEQTSMSSYPNAMVLGYLRQSSNPNPELIKKSEDLLQRGYKKLTGFETKQKGYEWFGGAPAHEALTAYGLMQFKDMQKVAPEIVDQGMVERTAEWLLSRRDGKGGFLRSSQALDNFGRADEDITNAYIIYGLAEAGFQQLDLEVKKMTGIALDKKDPYVLALMANTLWLLKKPEEAREMTRALMATRKEDGSWTGSRHSITYSTEQALNVETTGFAIMALIRSDEADKAVVEKAVSFLCGQRQARGGFGNSQSTIVALKALTAFVVYSKRAVEDGAFNLMVNGKEAAKAEWKAGTQKAIRMEGWESLLSTGRNTLEFKYSLLKDPLPFTIGIDYFTKLPQSAPNAPLGLSAKLSSEKTALGKPVELELELKNNSAEGKPMSIACVSIPAGCTVSPAQFRELMETKKVDFYEVKGNMIYLYFRQMAPSEIKKLSITLSPVLRGKYESSASSAYLYYTAEKKDWAQGLRLEID